MGNASRYVRLTRRDFLSTATAFLVDPQTPPDLTLTIGTVEVAIAPKRTIRTICTGTRSNW
jgi:hypothetical protein